jgi:hypothetical protein
MYASMSREWTRHAAEPMRGQFVVFDEPADLLGAHVEDKRRTPRGGGTRLGQPQRSLLNGNRMGIDSMPIVHYTVVHVPKD